MNTKELEKELEKLEAASKAAHTIYHATDLNDPDIEEVYLSYKDAYNALSYARFLNTDKGKQYLDKYPGFISFSGREVGKRVLHNHMAD